MRFLLLSLFMLLCSYQTWAKLAPPANDEIADAIKITNTSAFCTDDATYNNLEATQTTTYAKPMGWLATGKDVWFKFTASKYDVNISVTGKVNAASTNTMVAPLVALYTFEANSTSISEMIGTSFSSNNVTSLYKGSLTIGQEYYIRVSAVNDNTGTFKLCVDNYFPPIKAGQDCISASILCSKESFTQLNVTGAGKNNTESEGTCLGRESNSSWYLFKASKAGTLTFVITPSVTTNDIDWVFYDLGIDGDCSKINLLNAIRCAAGSGVTCTPSYYKTGLSMTETDLTESSGCPNTSQNGFVKYVDLVEGNTYALLIDNFSSGNNGFTIEFDGTADFAGPTSEILFEKLSPCTDAQAYVFESKSENYTSLKWSFGEGASMTSSTEKGPFKISYSTPGEKVVVLEAMGSNGCNVITTQSFIVAKTPDKPLATASSVNLCQGEVLQLSTPAVKLATYHWSGPNNFSSPERNPTIPVTGPEVIGTYKLLIQVGDCVSPENSLEILSVDLKPEADFSIVTNNKCEANQSFTLVNASKNYTKVSWDFGNGVGSNTNTLNDGKIITYLTPGLRTITLTIETPNGCIATKSVDLTVEVKPETPVIAINQPLFCIGDVIKLSVPILTGIVYEWTGPDNFKATTNAIEIPITNLNQAGTYSVSLTSGSCIPTIASIVIPPIAKIPVANFYTEPGFNGKYSVPAPINFVNKSTDADFYEWEFGDGFTSTETNPLHTFKTDGLFKIKLTAFSKNGCFNSIILGDLLVKKESSIFTPNSFTPNGDGINDEFIVGITNLKRYKLQIFNRYGSVVFLSENIYDNWKGVFKGNDLPVGIYYYLILGTTLKNENVKYSGSVMLLR
ncbi:PKD domain-containing protein [Pedobacter sp. Leaf170]|uniref:PKD domain-containing protein n=1 Tax=Pedobacter sp. Leaf170 TaxID=2876558 RepID=UPI001E49F4A7|nr:PKD domain-containing protein [Pedobacter sp. Leaf170]